MSPSIPTGGAVPDELPDALAAGFAAGDPACLAEAYRRWSPVVHTAALRAAGDPAVAEDVTRRVFVLAWQSREKLTAGDGTLLGMLVRFTREQLALVLTRSGGQSSLDDVVRRILVVDGLWNLPADDRHVLTLALWDGLTPEQIGTRLGLPPETVRGRLRDALEELQRRAEVNDDTAY